MNSILEGFDGKMEPTSIAASVYSVWHYFFMKSLLWNLTSNKDEFWDEKKRLSITDTYYFFDFYMKVVKAASDGDKKYNKVC
jgi:hypothetical protein